MLSIAMAYSTVLYNLDSMHYATMPNPRSQDQGTLTSKATILMPHTAVAYHILAHLKRVALKCRSTSKLKQTMAWIMHVSMTRKHCLS